MDKPKYTWEDYIYTIVAMIFVILAYIVATYEFDFSNDIDPDPNIIFNENSVSNNTIINDTSSNYTALSKSLLEGTIDFIKGNSYHIAPDSMALNEISKVSLSITDSDRIDYMISRVRELSNDSVNVIVTRHNITIGRIMNANLTSSSNLSAIVFEIIPKTREEQVVNLYDNQSVDWVWDVIPKELGEYELDLTLEVLLKNDLGNNYSSIPIFNKKVKVFIKPELETPEYNVIAEKTTTAIDNEDVIPSKKTELFDSINSLSVAEQPLGSQSGINNMSYIFIITITSIITVIVVFVFAIKLYLKEKGIKTIVTEDIALRFDEHDIIKLDKFSREGKIEKALEYILSKLPLSQGKLRQDVVFYLNSYKRNEKERLQNFLTNDEYNRNNSKIARLVIKLISEFKQKV